MPPFPERESSILAILKKKKPGIAEGLSVNIAFANKTPSAASVAAKANFESAVTNGGNVDLLGISTNGVMSNGPAAPVNNTSVLVDVFGDLGSTTNNGPLSDSGVVPGDASSGTAVVVNNDESLKK